MKIESDENVEAIVHAVLFALPLISDARLDGYKSFPPETDLVAIDAASKVLRAYVLHRTELEKMKEKVVIYTDLLEEDPKRDDIRDELIDLKYFLRLGNPRGIRRVRSAVKEFIEPLTYLDHSQDKAMDILGCLWWHLRKGVMPDTEEVTLYTLWLHDGMPESLLV